MLVPAHEDQHAKLDDLTLAEQIASRILDRLAEVQLRRFVSVREAAVYTNLSQHAIRGLLAGGKLTALRPVKGRVVIDRRELESYVLSSRRRPTEGRGQHRSAAPRNGR